MQLFHILNWCYWTHRTELRIASPYSTFPHHGRAPLARDHACATHALQFGDATGMVEMHMRIQNDFHILNAKAE